jgi:hypothetical protein
MAASGASPMDGAPAWRVGHGAVPITPDGSEGVLYLAGYDDRSMASVRDALEAHALALECDGDAVMVLSLDLLGLMRPDALALQEAVRTAVGAPGLEVLVACTHTHAAPDLVGLWGPSAGQSGVNPCYRQRVLAAGAAAGAAAWRARRPASFRGARAWVGGVAHNARDPGLLDPWLTSLSWRDATGETVARILHFACHPEVLGRGDRRASADLAGAARRVAAGLLGGPSVYWQGALGGMVTPQLLPGEAGEQALVRLGLLLGGAAADLAAREVPLRGGLSVRRTAVELPLENPRFAAAAAAGVLPRPPEQRAQGPVVISSAGVLDLGPVRWLLAPGEVLPALAREWSARGAAAADSAPEAWPPGILGLCDDEVGYILRPADFHPGRYEEGMSLGAATAPLLAAAYARLGAWQGHAASRENGPWGG